MEFDKSRCYSAINADELKPGDKVIVAQQLGNLKHQVGQKDFYVWTIKEIKGDTYSDRFVTGNGAFPLAYLVERKENCTNCSEGKWDAKHQNILCDPVQCPNGNVVFRNQEVEVCEYWKPKTEKVEKPDLISLGNGQYVERENMTEMFLSLDDAVRVAEMQFDIDPVLAKIEFEQKCYMPNDQYEIGFQDGLSYAVKAIESIRGRAE